MSNQKVCALIPARLHSSRLPGKLLLPLGARSVLQVVYDQVLQCKSIDGLMVVTDHAEIYQHVQSWGGQVMMSKREHESGTDRIAEAVENLQEFSYFVNVQGDEPFIMPESIDRIVYKCKVHKAGIGTLISSLTEPNEFNNPNVVKAVTDSQGYALYFSRASIPFSRERPLMIPECGAYRHIGLYVFKKETLERITKWPVSGLERTEKLEQLRWLENGEKILTEVVSLPEPGIDTREDYERALQILGY